MPLQVGRVVAGYAGFGDGRQILEHRRAPLLADGVASHGAGVRMRRDRIEALEHELDVARDQVVHGRRAAAR